MGHLRLNRLLRTPKWIKVVELLEQGATTPQIAAKSLAATEEGLKGAANDSDLVYAFWLLTQLPLAARSDFFPGELRRLNLDVSDKPTLMEITSAFIEAVDSHLTDIKERTEFFEMGNLAATESLTSLVGSKTPSLFGTVPEDVQKSIASFATKKQFGILGREFVSRLTERYLGYFLSAELSNHIGEGRRFRTVKEQREFSKALQTHCYQAAKIVEDFAGSWYSKANFEGGITIEKAEGFLGHALKKMREELGRGGQVEAN